MKRHRVRVVSAGAAALLIAAGGIGVANAVSPAAAGDTFYACVNDGKVLASTIELNTQPHCSNAQTLTQWNAQGPAGPGTTAFGSNTNTAVAGRGTQCTLGEAILSAGTVANGIPANGQLLSISQNTVLFSLLGTIYGGDGRTTFALPDLRSAAPNNMTYSICAEGVYPSRN